MKDGVASFFKSVKIQLYDDVLYFAEGETLVIELEIIGTWYQCRPNPVLAL